MAETNFGRPDGVPYIMWVKNGFELIMDAAQTEKPFQIKDSSGNVIFSIDKDGVTVASGAVAAKNPVVAVTADGAIAVPSGNTDYFITKAGVAAMTIADPANNAATNGKRLQFISATANAHTLDNSAGSGFFSSGGATKDVATWGGAIGDRLTIEAYAGKWYIVDLLNITLG